MDLAQRLLLVSKALGFLLENWNVPVSSTSERPSYNSKAFLEETDTINQDTPLSKWKVGLGTHATCCSCKDATVTAVLHISVDYSRLSKYGAGW